MSFTVNTQNGEFHYYYNSKNNMLFENAFTICNVTDVTKFMKKVMALDLSTNYYLTKPDSNWTLASLTNFELEVINIPDTLIS